MAICFSDFPSQRKEAQRFCPLQPIDDQGGPGEVPLSRVAGLHQRAASAQSASEGDRADHRQCPDFLRRTGECPENHPEEVIYRLILLLIDFNKCPSSPQGDCQLHDVASDRLLVLLPHGGAAQATVGLQHGDLGQTGAGAALEGVRGHDQWQVSGRRAPRRPRSLVNILQLRRNALWLRRGRRILKLINGLFYSVGGVIIIKG